MNFDGSIYPTRNYALTPAVVFICRASNHIAIRMARAAARTGNN
jgi:hypothetical protein